jgi:hypothetical protein
MKKLKHKGARRSATVALSLALTIATIVVSQVFANTARASHHTRWTNVFAPFSGYWNDFSQSDPPTHPRGAIALDWATDFYQTPGALGEWYSVSSDASGHIETMASQSNACGAGSWTTAGYRYRFDMAWSSAPSTVYGHWVYTHVDPEVPGTSNTVYPSGSMSQGEDIGYTWNWAYSVDCWEVVNDAGVHWHIGGYNQSHYACWVPWNDSDYLTKGADSQGAVNSNALSDGASCW